MTGKCFEHFLHNKGTIMESIPTRLGRFVATALGVTAITLFSGCFSSRTLIEDLAKTPHLLLQDSQQYAAMNSFQQDFLYLTETVRETHPEPYAAWSKEEFDREQQSILQSLAAETSRVGFEKSLRSFLSRLRDSHTNAQTSWTASPREYPVSFFWIKDTLILASVGNEQDTTLIGSHVLNFNGLPVNEIFARMSQFIMYENVYQARKTLSYYFVLPTYLRDAGILTTDTLALSLITRDGTARTYSVLPVEHPKRIAPYKSNPITQPVNKPFSYKILPADHACYLQWNTMMDLRVVQRLSFFNRLLAYPVMWYRGIGYFDNFLENMFEEMKEKEITTLIVDLRGNGGGRSAYGDQLLYFLDAAANIKGISMSIRFSPLYREFFPENYAAYAADYAKKYNGRKLPDSLLVTSDFAQEDSSETESIRNVSDKDSEYRIKPDRTIFKGNTYFLVGDGTYSSAIILTSLVQDNKLFPTVGQPTRGRPSHYGETLVIKLPNSGIVCRISCKKFFRPDVTKDAEDSLYPDVTIWPTFEDAKSGRDPVLEWAIENGKGKSKK
jgi:hypothetical protein